MISVFQCFLLWMVSVIIGCNGYDRVLDFDNGDCDTYEFHDITQYQSYLVRWSGVNFGFSYCIMAFHGENSNNVATTYNVCFKVKRYYFDCGINVEFIDGLLNSYGDNYDCTTPPPDEWCTTSDDYAKLKIIAKKDTPSILELEVTVTAAVSLTIGAALGIAAAGLTVLSIIIIFLVVRNCKNKTKPPSSGRVVRVLDDLQGTEFEGEIVVGYPTQQTIMQPHRGGYRPMEVTVQHTTRYPGSTQSQVRPSAPPLTNQNDNHEEHIQDRSRQHHYPETHSRDRGRQHHYPETHSRDRGRQHHNPETHSQGRGRQHHYPEEHTQETQQHRNPDTIDLSAPPPSYDECKDIR